MRVTQPKEFPHGLYAQVVKYMPITTVDFLITNNTGQFLLGYRKNKPAQNQWWIPGGRVWKGETQAQAIKRKLKEETGLTAKNATFVGVFDPMFKDSAFKVPTHCISLMYAIEPATLKTLRRDSQHGELRWFKKIDPKWHPYLKKQLRAAGCK